MKSTNKDMADSTFFWGVGKTYCLGIAVSATSYEGISDKIKQKIDRKTTALANKIKRNHGHVKPGIKTKVFFHVMRMLQRHGWNEADVNYWKEKGWDKKQRPWKSV